MLIKEKMNKSSKNLVKSGTMLQVGVRLKCAKKNQSKNKQVQANCSTFLFYFFFLLFFFYVILHESKSNLVECFRINFEQI